jgi:hypothetical protein
MGRTGLAVAAAEQEDKTFQVLAQLRNPVGGVSEQLFQGGGQAGGVAGSGVSAAASSVL